MLRQELARIVGAQGVQIPPPAEYLQDASAARGVIGTAAAVVLPETPEQVASIVEWCYGHDIAVVPRGGGTGFSGAAVPDGGVVLSLERLTRIRSFEPLLWRIAVDAGVRTQRLGSLARSNGLFFPPNPGAAEQSQIGGNLATNAAGAHCYKYGPIRDWVTGLEVVLPPGRLVMLGGPLRKDSSSYDLKSLLIGSEGTLGVITGAWLKLLPAPEAQVFVAAAYATTSAGCAAIDAIRGNGLLPAAVEFIDKETMRLAGHRFPWPTDDAFVVIVECDGTKSAALQLRRDVVDVLGEDAEHVYLPDSPAEVSDMQRWRDGISFAVAVQKGAKISEDVAVPVEDLIEALTSIEATSARRGVVACSWGHAGDGNIHASFLFDPNDDAERARAEAAAGELVALILSLGGSASGEHGVGTLKKKYIEQQLPELVRRTQRGIKRVFDPKLLMNPGKKLDANDGSG